MKTTNCYNLFHIKYICVSGSYECKLCLTLHNNEGSYLAHTQGKKHQANLARRAAKEAKDAPQQVSVFLHPYSTWFAFLTHGSATVL